MEGHRGVSERLNLARYETIQAYYSIAGRDLERELVPLMVGEQVGLMVWSPLAGGLRLDEVSALPAEYPGWMLERQGPGRYPKPFEPKG